MSHTSYCIFYPFKNICPLFCIFFHFCFQFTLPFSIMSGQELALYLELNRCPFVSFLCISQCSVELFFFFFYLFPYFLTHTNHSYYRVLINLLQNVEWPGSLFIVSSSFLFCFVFLFMCSGRAWQFFIACWTWCRRSCRHDINEYILPLLGTQRDGWLFNLIQFVMKWS